MRKIILIILGLVLVIFIGTYVYKILTISSVYPPIKEYEYSGSVNHLITGIGGYASTNPKVSFKITDTVGNSNTGYAIRLDIEIKHQMHDITYNLQCEEKRGIDVSPKTIVELLGAYDKTDNIGGYIAEAKGVKLLVDDFETDFLFGLKHSQNVQVIPRP